MKRFLIDALDLGHNTKGVSRVLANLIPHLARESSETIVVAVTSEGRDLVDAPGAEIVVVPRPLQSRWEQWDLPRLARRVQADAVYSHRECGPLWGPPLVLHVPEDPEVRWRRDPPSSSRDKARRLYSRVLLGRALHHAAVVAASTPSVAHRLAAQYRLAPDRVRVIPLGVDLELFHPAQSPKADAIFHLGSSDPRDETILVVDAWAWAQQTVAVPPLVIGGDLGSKESRVRERAADLGITVQLTGRLDDHELATKYREAAVVVQPSSDEGFGLQPLEALASGSSLVVTDEPSVTRLVADAAIVATPTETGLGEAIVAALTGDRRRAARSRALSFSWSRSAAAVSRSLTSASDVCLDESMRDNL